MGQCGQAFAGPQQPIAAPQKLSGAKQHVSGSPPKGAPSNINVAVLDASRLHVSWEFCFSSVLAVTSHSIFVDLGHSVFLYDSISRSLVGPAQFQNVKPVPSSITAVVIPGLRVGMTCRVKICAHNMVGSGPCSAFTAPITISAPSQAPTGVALKIRDARSLCVSWVPPVSMPEVTMFKITVIVGNKEFWYDHRSGSLVDPTKTKNAAFVPSSLNSVFITGGSAFGKTLPENKYEVKISARNAVGWGPFCVSPAPVTVTTPKHTPTNISVEVLDAQRICVTWVAPKCTPKATHYDLRINDGQRDLVYDNHSGTLVDPATSQNLAAIPSLTSVIISGLSGATCRATLSAWNGVGWGPRALPSSPVTVSAPKQAPSLVVLQAVAGQRLRVSWGPPWVDSGEGASCIPEVKYYSVMVDSGQGELAYDNKSGLLVDPNRHPQAVPASVLSLLITGLSASVTCRVRVRACNIVGWGPFSLQSASATTFSLQSAPATVRQTIQAAPAASSASSSSAGIPPQAVLVASGNSSSGAVISLPAELPVDLSPSATRPRTLLTSRYLSVYNVTPKKPQAQKGATKAVESLLRSLNRADAADCYRQFRSDGRTVAEAAVALWTGEGDASNLSIYIALNRALLADDEDQLAHWMFLVRLVTNYITRPAHELPSALTTWRGSKLSRLQAASLSVGQVIRPPMFVATSTNREVASHFRKIYIVKLIIPAGCRNACRVDTISLFKEELEVLLPPYTPMRILRLTANEIDLEVLDSLQHMNVESSTKISARAFPI